MSGTCDVGVWSDVTLAVLVFLQLRSESGVDQNVPTDIGDEGVLGGVNSKLSRRLQVKVPDNWKDMAGEL